MSDVRIHWVRLFLRHRPTHLSFCTVRFL